MRPVPRPDETDTLASLLLGPDPVAEPLPEPRGDGVRAALERVLLPALERAPCTVSFSGGRDSSAVLAVAADVARRHGLPEPVPVVMRFPDAPETDETRWQRMVLEHLDLRAEEIVFEDQLEVLGEISLDVLRRLGVHWPANAHLHVPVLEQARGGALLTGVGGDELLGTQGSRHVQLLRRGDRPRREDARAVIGALAPRRLRAIRQGRRFDGDFTWLTAEGHAHVRSALVRDGLGWPHRWDRSLRHWHRSRAYAAVAGGIALVARPYDVRVVNPLVEPAVLAELARDGGPAGYPGRTAAMRRLFGDLLPEAILSRPTKAGFTRPVFRARARAFADRWDGRGVPAHLVDADALRAVWLSERPDFRTALLLQHAWLAQEAGSAASS